MEKGSKLHLHKLKNFAILASVFEPTVVAPFILTSSPFAVANDSHLFLTHPHRVSSFFWTVKSPHNQRFPFTLIHFLISQFCYISSTPHPHANIVFRDCFISLFPFFPRSKHPPARNTNPQGSTLSQFLAPYFNSPLYFLFEFIIPVRGSDRSQFINRISSMHLPYRAPNSTLRCRGATPLNFSSTGSILRCRFTRE